MIKEIYHAVPQEIWMGGILITMVVLFVVTTTFFAIWAEGGISMKMSNSTYDRMKWVAQYLLPALGTLYFALAQIWGLPFGQEIVGTIAALDTFLGVILGISTAAYNKDGDSE